MTYIACVPAAGMGRRMTQAMPKQYLSLLGKPLIWHTLTALHAVTALAHIAVILSLSDTDWEQYDWTAFDRLSVLRCGGVSRAETVKNAVQTLSERYPPQTWVLVHDAARPCLHPHWVTPLLTRLSDDPVGGILALPMLDTLKQVKGLEIVGTKAREGMWQAQTPQMFRLHLLQEALRRDYGEAITDESSAIEKMGLTSQVVPGHAWNIKVTYPDDLALAALILGAGQ